LCEVAQLHTTYTKFGSAAPPEDGRLTLEICRGFDSGAGNLKLSAQFKENVNIFKINIMKFRTVCGSLKGDCVARIKILIKCIC
jgi:hypothetical protein